MTTTDSTTATQTIVKVQDLRKAIKSALPAASKGSDVPILNTVRFVAKGGTLTILATDRYVVSRFVIDLDSHDDWTFTMRATDAKNLATMIPASGISDATLTLTRTEGFASLTTETLHGNFTHHEVAGDYPAVERLILDIDKVRNNGIPDVFAFGGAKLAQVVAMAKALGKSSNPEVRFHGGDKSHQRVLLTSAEDVRWSGLIMPRRIA